MSFRLDRIETDGPTIEEAAMMDIAELAETDPAAAALHREWMADTNKQSVSAMWLLPLLKDSAEELFQEAVARTVAVALDAARAKLGNSNNSTNP